MPARPGTCRTAQIAIRMDDIPRLNSCHHRGVVDRRPLGRSRPAGLLCRGCESRVDHEVGIAADRRIVRFVQPTVADGGPATRRTALPQRTRRKSAVTPKVDVCRLGTMRKLATPETSFRSAAVMAALRTADLSCAERAPFGRAPAARAEPVGGAPRYPRKVGKSALCPRCSSHPPEQVSHDSITRFERD